MAAKTEFVALRISAEGLAYIDKLAEQAGASRSEMVRQLLAEAVTARARNRTAAGHPTVVVRM